MNEKVSKVIDGKLKHGYHTFKNFYLGDKMPKFVTAFVDPMKFVLEEETWNFCEVGEIIFTNSNFMKDDFFMIVGSTNIDGDDGSSFNPLNLSSKDLAIRTIVFLDIATDAPQSSYYKSHFMDDPTSCHFSRSGRRPLKPGWLDSYSGPLMTVYKLIRTQFKWFGLQTWIERRIVYEQQEYLLIFHRRLFCLTDQWYGKTEDQLERLENETIEELNYLRKHAGKRGFGAKVEPMQPAPSRPRPTPAPRSVRPEAPEEKPEDRKVDSAPEQIEEIEEYPEAPKVSDAESVVKGSVISRWMRPVIVEVVEGSRRKIIIRSHDRDIVLTLLDEVDDEKISSLEES